MSRTQTTLSPDQQYALWDCAEEYDGRLRSYSGRGMYGEECLGISVHGDAYEFVMRLALRLADEGYADVADTMARSVCSDSLGRGTILYFPAIAPPRNADLDEED